MTYAPVDPKVIKPTSEALARVERYIDSTYKFTGGRLYFTPREVDVLTSRLDEPALVSETTGLDYNTCVNLCDGLNSTLKAAGYIAMPFYDEDHFILADCILNTDYPDYWKDDPVARRRALRKVGSVAAKLRGIGVAINA